MAKALLLFSGGLDSILAAKILIGQKIKVYPICFKSCFFNCDLAEKSVKKLGLKLKIVDFSKKHLKIVKSPKHGYGKRTNPCIDCRMLMLRGAKEIMKKQGFDFIATGEVLDERPFSQNKRAFKLIEKEAGLENMILRPLSAKLLPETISEKKGLIKREKLFEIRGKSRKPHFALAKKLRIKEIPTPAGGCILTDPEYSKRLRELFKKAPGCDELDCQVLRKGRAIWKDSFLIMIGRNEKENEELKKLKKKKDIILEPENFPGPTVLIRGFGKKITKGIVDMAKDLLLEYSKKIPKTIKIQEN